MAPLRSPTATAAAAAATATTTATATAATTAATTSATTSALRAVSCGVLSLHVVCLPPSGAAVALPAACVAFCVHLASAVPAPLLCAAVRGDSPLDKHQAQMT